MRVMRGPAQAVAAFERAVELHRGTGNGSVPAILLVWHGEARAHLGWVERAASALAEAFPTLERANAAKALAIALAGFREAATLIRRISVTQ